MGGAYVRQHPKKCQCDSCVERKLSIYRKRVREMSQIRIPEEDQLIPVRAHFRRHPRYLKDEPALAMRIRLMVQHLKQYMQYTQHMRKEKK